MTISALAAAALLVMLIVGIYDVRDYSHCRMPGSELTYYRANRYVRKTYPKWLAAHSDRRCPTSLAEVTADTEPLLDSWNHPFVIDCDAPAPNGFGLRSAGADSLFGTSDDVVSWTFRAAQPPNFE